MSTTINVGNGPSAIALTPDGSFAYVVNYFDYDVSIIDIATNTNLGTDIPTGSGSNTYPVDIKISADGTRAYVVNDGDNTVSVIDLTTDTNLGTDIPTNNSPLV